MVDEMTKAFVCTGVYATPEEIEVMKGERALPVARIGGMWPSPERTMHAYAIAHGLPEIRGFYGCDFRDGEFIRVKDEDMEPGEPTKDWGAYPPDDIRNQKQRSEG